MYYMSKTIQGWYDPISKKIKEIQSDPRCWQVGTDGVLVHDVMLRDWAKSEFKARGLEAADKDLDLVNNHASGHSDYVAKLARGFRDLEELLSPSNG